MYSIPWVCCASGNVWYTYNQLHHFTRSEQFSSPGTKMTVVWFIWLWISAFESNQTDLKYSSWKLYVYWCLLRQVDINRYINCCSNLVSIKLLFEAMSKTAWMFCLCILKAFIFNRKTLVVSYSPAIDPCVNTQHTKHKARRINVGVFTLNFVHIFAR